ncbi:MAG TPA: alanine racemase [Thermodesulfovibrionales bacterium]|nr:alanine racemase [Thermodesulfovibrionales bacterium]
MNQEVIRGAVAEIDLNAIAYNLGIVKAITRDRPVIAVVKADAYGHGVAEVSRRLENEGVAFLAVAFIDEGVKLRDAGIRLPILVLFDKYDSAAFFEYRLIPVIHDLQTARRLSEEAGKRKTALDVHLKIDTGMGRLGFCGKNEIEKVVGISKTGCLNVRGLMSHFSDSDISDKSFAIAQIRRFHETRELITRETGRPLLCHMANSAATISLPDAYFDAVRPGLMLYGYSPFGDKGVHFSENTLKPAMRVKAKILSLRKLQKGTPVSYGRTFITARESVIAVLSVGYADGYSRHFSNAIDVIVKGKRAPVVGRVCMDLTMADVTGIEEVEEGEEAILLGTEGSQEVSAWEMAGKAATIPYEVLTVLGNRSRRIYV